MSRFVTGRAQILRSKPKPILWLGHKGDNMVNKVMLIGNLGADPEMIETKSGSNVCKLRLATTDRRKDKDTGDWADHTEWHNVVCFGKTANNVGKYCHKGKQIYVEGRMQTRKWQDKEGNNRYSTEVIGDSIRFLKGGSEQQQPRRTSSRPQQGSFQDDQDLLY
jgi:single-strand DNA-binding protein